jgi:hypothetical protein
MNEKPSLKPSFLEGVKLNGPVFLVFQNRVANIKKLG